MVEFFEYQGEAYRIVLRRVEIVGDFDPRRKIAYIDRQMPEKFHKGIAVHEVIERPWIVKGCP